MKAYQYIALCLAALLLAGCGVKKQVVETVVEEEPTVQIPEWHTCLIQGARASIITSHDKMSATLTMQTVRDSMIVISVMPLLGMEMMRLEATPLEVRGIDKLHGQYADATFAELNRKLRPELNWDILQQLCTAELLTGDQKARLMYAFDDDYIELIIDYPARQLDVPVRVMHQNTNRYTKIDINKWL